MVGWFRKIMGKPNDIPGFTLRKDPKQGWVYSVDEKYIGGNRSTRLMPVNPQYEVVRGVELSAYPQIVTHEEVAANPRNENLPSVDKLTDENFHKGRVSPASGGLFPDRVSGPVELHPYADNIFVFPVIRVSCTYGTQPLNGKTDGFGLRGVTPISFREGRLVLFEDPEDVDGLAYVSHVRVPSDFRSYFNSPRYVDNFTGRLPVSREALSQRGTSDRLAYELFNDLLKEKIEQIGQQVEELRKMPVKGVLLSPIKADRHLHDAMMTIAYDPEGEFIVAASYLV